MITLKQSDIDPEIILITSTRVPRFQHISQDILWTTVHIDILADLFPEHLLEIVCNKLSAGEEVACECVLINNEE